MDGYIIFIFMILFLWTLGEGSLLGIVKLGMHVIPDI